MRLNALRTPVAIHAPKPQSNENNGESPMTMHQTAHPVDFGSLRGLAGGPEAKDVLADVQSQMYDPSYASYV